jgi:ABC-type transport system involved in multi-copper enzyme maturation permease subunit
MIRAIRSELTRLKNPYFILGGVGLMTVFGVLATLIVFLTAGNGSSAGSPGPPGSEGVTIKALEASDGMFAGIQNIGSMLGIVALAIWAIFVTSDYASGLIRLLVQAEPSRWRLLGGKVVALTGFTCLATLVTTVVVLVVSPGVASLAGVSTDAWSSGLLHTALTGYVDLTLSVLLWGVVGLFVGMVTRSTGLSIGIGIGYLLVFEGLVSMVLDNASKWLPGSAFSAIGSGGSADMTYGTALLVAAGYAVAAIAIAAVTFRRRDITA